ncbi:MAG TPA: hypothetical protein VD886_05445 [Herpetosiphonaceae bacterium]|nr:hypothetical protein [Herpetosiphonaceae bacterium]
MVDLLKLVRSNPDQRDLFIRLFTEIYHGIHQVPEYLMAFCMRELRYAEIRSLYVNECAGDQNTAQFRRRMNHISHVMHAFDDEVWEDADMWSYYAHELREGGAE